MKLTEILMMPYYFLEDMYERGYLTFVIIGLILAIIIFLWKGHR